MGSFIRCITVDYFNFSDRASRSEYWFFILGLIIVYFVVVFGFVLGNKLTGVDYPKSVELTDRILAIFLFFPHLAVSVRRLHDLNKSGWLYLICLFPIIGQLYLLIQYCLVGTEGTNNYGEDPLA